MPSARIFAGQKKQGRARTLPCVKHEPVLLLARSSASPPVPHIHIGRSWLTNPCFFWRKSIPAGGTKSLLVRGRPHA